MKFPRKGGLLALLSIAALSRAPAALSEPAQPATSLSEYVYLHETRSQSVLLQVAAHANMCPGPRS